MRFLSAKKLLFLAAALLMTIGSCVAVIAASQHMAPAAAAFLPHLAASNAGPASEEEKYDPWKTLEILAGIFALAFGVGAAWGVANSPNYEDNRVVAEYVARNVTVLPRSSLFTKTGFGRHTDDPSQPRPSLSSARGWRRTPRVATRGSGRLRFGNKAGARCSTRSVQTAGRNVSIGR